MRAPAALPWTASLLTCLAAPLAAQPSIPDLAAEHDLDADVLQRIVTRAEESKSDGVVILRRGQTVGEWDFGSPDGPIESMSATKSIVTLAFGRLLADGRLDSIDTPVHRFYPEWNQGRKADVTIRHLLAHRSGLQSDRITTEIYRAPDFVQLALCAELAEDPGTRFRYNNKACNLLAGLVERISGTRMDMLIGQEIFAPMGITDWSWSLDPAGNPHAMAGLQIRPPDLAKIGQLMLDGGLWEGNRILPAQFVAECVHDQVHPAPEESETISDLWGPAYGLQWWITADTHFAITDRLLSEWRRLEMPEETVAKLAELKDLRGEDLMRRTREVVGGEAAWGALTYEAGRPDFDIVGRTHRGFRADGYLGQYLVVVPEHDLVAVRMMRAPQGAFDPSKLDTFRDFQTLVRGLVE